MKCPPFSSGVRPDVKYSEKVERRLDRIPDVGYSEKMECRKWDRLRVHGVGPLPLMTRSAHRYPEQLHPDSPRGHAARSPIRTPLGRSTRQGLHPDSPCIPDLLMAKDFKASVLHVSELSIALPWIPKNSPQSRIALVIKKLSKHQNLTQFD